MYLKTINIINFTQIIKLINFNILHIHYTCVHVHVLIARRLRMNSI